MSGGGIGTGAGGLLGTLAGVALAPETGGLSLAIPAIAGAAGSELGNVATGNTVNPLMAALMGGISGGLGGAGGLGDTLGIGNSAGLFGDAGASGISGAADAAAADASSFAPLDNAVSGAGNAGITAADPTASLAGEPIANTGSVGTDNLVNNFSAQQATSAAPGTQGAGSSMLGSVGKYLAKQNPLTLALTGETALSGIQSLLPKPKVNIGQTAAQVEATDPGFNATLPQYKMQNTATPYQGNWYTYGQQPEPAMYNAQPVLQAHGGLVDGYAKGGNVSKPKNRVNPLSSVMPHLQLSLHTNRPTMVGGFPSIRKYAVGGPVMPGTSPAILPQGNTQQKINPLQLAAAHKIGMAIGQHLKSHGYDPHKTPDGKVHGKGGGQDDAIPARLSQDEFIIPADVVSALGDGSSNEGGKKLDKMLHDIRAHKTSKGSGFPPKVKDNPLSYVGGA